MSSPRFRLVAALMLCLPLAACVTWRRVPEPVDPGVYIQRETPKKLRVHLVSGESRTLDGPRVRGDSILSREAVRASGLPAGSPWSGRTHVELWLPQVAIEDIVSLDAEVDQALPFLAGVAGLLGWWLSSLQQ